MANSEQQKNSWLKRLITPHFPSLIIGVLFGIFMPYLNHLGDRLEEWRGHKALLKYAYYNGNTYLKCWNDGETMAKEIDFSIFFRNPVYPKEYSVRVGRSVELTVNTAAGLEISGHLARLYPSVPGLKRQDALEVFSPHHPIDHANIGAEGNRLATLEIPVPTASDTEGAVVQ